MKGNLEFAHLEKFIIEAFKLFLASELDSLHPQSFLLSTAFCYLFEKKRILENDNFCYSTKVC